MDILYLKEHLGCYNYDKEEKPQIEVLKIVKGQSKKLHVTANEIVFFMEGRIKFQFHDFLEYEATKGQFFFLSAGGRYSYYAVTSSVVIIFRLLKPVIRLCEVFPIERLYNLGKSKKNTVQPDTTPHLRILDITARLWSFLEGVNDCISDGIKCRCYFELKIKELLLYLRIYYEKEDLHEFFFLILSEDIVFSEYVRLHWQHFKTIRELADSMHLSRRQFSSRFISAFGKKPQEWMNESRAQVVHREITSTRKLFKQIAIEQGFAQDAILTRFCKKELNATPTEIRENNASERRSYKEQ